MLFPELSDIVINIDIFLVHLQSASDGGSDQENIEMDEIFGRWLNTKKGVLILKKLIIIALVLMLSLTAGLAAFAAPDKDIVDTAIDAAPEFTTLVAAIQAAGLVDALKGDGPFTVFAPTNAAFAALPEGVLDKLLANPDILAKVLLYHVVAGQVDSTAVVGLDGTEIETLGGQKVLVSVVGGEVFINDAKADPVDIFCTNGVIHVIDKVLVPEWDIVETAILNEDFNTLVAALKAADLVDALKGAGPFTVFAPTDEAFDNLPDGLLAALLDDTDSLTKVLLYHVVSGAVFEETVLTLDGVEVETLLGQKVLITIEDGKVFINDAEVKITDIECTNGVIHVLDAVLVPDLEADDLPDTGFSPDALYFGLIMAGIGVYIAKRRS